MSRQRIEPALCEKCPVVDPTKRNAPHACPYQHDVHDDDNDKYCTCCESCTQECADDI